MTKQITLTDALIIFENKLIALDPDDPFYVDKDHDSIWSKWDNRCIAKSAEDLTGILLRRTNEVTVNSCPPDLKLAIKKFKEFRDRLKSMERTVTDKNPHGIFHRTRFWCQCLPRSSKTLEKIQETISALKKLSKVYKPQPKSSLSEAERPQEDQGGSFPMMSRGTTVGYQTSSPLFKSVGGITVINSSAEKDLEAREIKRRSNTIRTPLLKKKGHPKAKKSSERYAAEPRAKHKYRPSSRASGNGSPNSALENDSDSE